MRVRSSWILGSIRTGRVVDIRIVGNFHEEIEHKLTIVTCFPDPKNDSGSGFEQDSHSLNLLSAFLQVRLIDTYCIYPEYSWLILQPKIRQCTTKVLCNSDITELSVIGSAGC